MGSVMFLLLSSSGGRELLLTLLFTKIGIKKPSHFWDGWKVFIF